MASFTAGSPRTLGVLNGASAFGVAANGTSVYFAATDSSGGGLFQLAVAAPPTSDGGVDGGTMAAKQVWTGGAASKPVDVVLDAANVYWTDEGNRAVYSMPLGGGTVSTMASGLMSPARIAVDSKNVYFTDPVGKALYEVPIGATTGGGTTPKALAKGLAVVGVAADDHDNRVYFSSPTQILSIAK